MVRPLLVVEENCQLRTSATWSHVATGGLVKKLTFCEAIAHIQRYSKEERGVGLVTGVQSCLHQGAPTYLWVVGEHVVPQDGGPGVWHLADVGDDNHWQGVSLQNGEFTVSRRLLHRELSSQ